MGDSSATCRLPAKLSSAISRLVLEQSLVASGGDQGAGPERWAGPECSLRTVKLLNDVLVDSDDGDGAGEGSGWCSQQQLVQLLQLLARRLSAAVPDVPALSSPALRLLKLMRETEQTETAAAVQREREETEEEVVERVREEVSGALGEVQTELETSGEALVSELLSQVRPGDVVMTLAGDAALHRQLASVARCHVLPVGGPGGVPLSGVEALMPRVDTVLMPAHTVLADGGVRGAGGARAVAVSARRHAVPLLVTAPVYRLSLLMCGGDAGRRLALARLGDPQRVLASRDHLDGECRVTVTAPLLDYVPPELVTLFVTQTGAVSPWFVHRLIADYYDAQDVALLSV